MSSSSVLHNKQVATTLFWLKFARFAWNIQVSLTSFSYTAMRLASLTEDIRENADVEEDTLSVSL